MKSVRDIIPQNNRSILFQDVSEESENILSLLGEIGEQESVSDEVIRSVEQSLLVHSAEEYHKKFPAIIYYSIEDGKIVISGSPGVCAEGRGLRTRCYADERELWEKLFARRQDRAGKSKGAAYRLFDDRENEKQKAHAAGGQSVLSALLEAENDRMELWYQNGGDVKWDRHVTEEKQEKMYDWLSLKLVVTGEETSDSVAVESARWKDVLLTLFCPQKVRSGQKSIPYLRMYEQAVYDFAA